MIELSTLIAFLLAIGVLLILPGPDMVFVLSHGITYGARGGMAAAFGICAAEVLLTLASAGGVGAVVATWPAAFDVIRYAGAAYLVWLAYGALRSRETCITFEVQAQSSARIFRMALLNCLINPKSLLFMLVFLPQFVDATRPDTTVQLLVLGAILTGTATAFNVVIGVFSGRIGALLSRSGAALAMQGWLLAAVFAGLALRLLVLERA